MKGQYPVRPARHYKLIAPPREPEIWPVDPWAHPRTYWHRLALEAGLVVIGVVAFGSLFYGLRGLF